MIILIKGAVLTALICFINGAVVSKSDYESAGLCLIPDEGSRRTAHPAVHFPRLGKPGEGKLWNVGCHSGPVFWHNGLISTTGSKANVTGDERRQLRTAIACAPPYTLPLFIRYQ